MKYKTINPLVLLGLVLSLAACAVFQTEPGKKTVIGADVPRSAQAFRDNPDHFQFVIVGDRTGGHRPGVFAQAVKQINWLQPEFVISVGDLIEGYSTDREELEARWREFDDKINSLEMPFFYVAGNHDISNELMADFWREQIGPDYYHFVYKDVLFLAINTEDPPTAQRRRDALAQLDPRTVQRAASLAHIAPEKAQQALAADPNLAQAAALLGGDETTISAAQVEHMRRALEENPDVRWTLVFMHKPAWKYPSPEFAQIEAMLADRPYSVFAGHYHYYLHEQRLGRDYIQLGATGGVRGVYAKGPGDMDHILWVTMTEEGPEIANIDLQGLYDRHGPGE